MPEDDLAHFVVAAAARVPLERFKINNRGTGDAQYHPHMMLALLVYCYCHGIMSSRKIERACLFDVRVRFVSANRKPDHDTIAAFRRENADAIKAAFLTVLELAHELKILKVGIVSVDGTKINANANIHKSIRYDRAVALRAQLKLEIEELMLKADTADATSTVEGASLPQEIARRKALHDKLDAAAKRLEAAARAEAAARTAAANAACEEVHESASDQGDDPPNAGLGSTSDAAPADDQPKPKTQTNLTDADSRIMRKNNRSEYRQCYNAQAAVDAGGTQLVLASAVTQSASDKNELIPMTEAVINNVGKPTAILADTGYANSTAIETVQGLGIEPLVAVGAGQRRAHDFRPAPPPKKERAVNKPVLKKMRDKLRDDCEAKVKYKLRKQTVEPVFGIIKQALGFRQFLLRGVDKVRTEWTLVTLAYNCRRLHVLTLA